MTIDKNKFNNNKLFLLAIVVVIIMFVLLGFLFKEDEKKVNEKELEENGVEKINKLVINEYMSSNNGTYVDEEGNIYDWIELYNGTNEDIDLKNYGLSDNKNQVKWIFPSVVIQKKSYLVIYLSGQNQNGLYAPFKLKGSGGETIALKKPSGKVADIIETIPLSSGESASRNLNGEFIVSKTPTPGYQNTKEGYNSLYSSLEIENNGIRISELLPKNNGNFSLDSKYPGYIELINTSENEISLDGYHISDDMNKLYKYKIENVTLKPNEIYLLFTGSNIQDEENKYLGFNFDNKIGKVFITNSNGKIIEKLEYENLANGIAKILINNNYYESSVISPGYLNNEEGIKEFSNKYLTIPKTLIINEVMNNNTSYLAQNGYHFYDWVELYNNSDEDINLSDYTLTTSTNNVKMYKLPDKILAKGEYYIIMASGEISLSNNSYNHANFKLSDVDSLYLCKDNKVIDSLVINDIPLNYSYGRGLENGFFYMENPTTLKQNKVGVQEISFAPTFSIEAGIYNNVESLQLELKSLGNVYYTLDGSTPNKNSKKYTEPIKITKTTVVKAVTIDDGKYKSDVITKSYIVNENHTLPVLSMSLSSSDLSRVMSNAEVSGNLEFYEEGGSFNTPCAISLFGGSARGIPKKSFGIRFKSKYGAGNLNYKLFDNRDTSVYQSIIIRSGSQDYNRAFMRDILGTSLVDEYTNVDVQAYKSAVLYINGNYYGVFNIREKVNADFIANHYNVDPDKVNLLQGVAEVQAGSRLFYNNMLNFVRTHNLALESNYEQIKKMVDIENVIDYWIAECYVTNNDIINIRYFSHPDINEGRIRIIFFDLDFAWKWFNQNYYSFMTNPEGMTPRFHVNTELLRNLMKNSEFKKTYLERLKYNLENTWKKENILNRLNEIYNKLYPEMERNQKRWGLTMATWNEEVNYIKKYIDKRQTSLLNQTKNYFKLSNAEFEKYFGGLK